MTIGVGTRMTCVHFVVSLLHAYTSLLRILWDTTSICNV